MIQGFRGFTSYILRTTIVIEAILLSPHNFKGLFEGSEFTSGLELLGD